MIKLRYDAETGLVGKGYPSNIEIPEPYKLITEEQHDQITTDTDHNERDISVLKEQIKVENHRIEDLEKG